MPFVAYRVARCKRCCTAVQRASSSRALIFDGSSCFARYAQRNVAAPRAVQHDAPRAAHQSSADNLHV
eukprot:365427-Chlamydomonas_euryale.AAC.12